MVLLTFRMVFMRPETLKIAISPRREHDFLETDVFEKTMQKLESRSPKPFQNCSKISAKSQKIAFENKNKSQHASLQLKVQHLNGRGARPNAPDPGSQAQETP